MQTSNLPDYVLTLPENHSLKVYFEENEFIKKLIQELKVSSPADDYQKFINIFNQICQVEKRYARKENQLFPFLEKRGWYGPSQGMWSFHDSIRDIIRAIRSQIENKQVDKLTESTRLLVENMQHMIHVEENRLFPNAFHLLHPEDWESMTVSDEEIGWVDKNRYTHAEEKESVQFDISKLKMDEGILNLEQINLILKFLPVDVTFVDENDKVAFYNRGEERVFPRSAGVIGREVRFCHPPKSVETVLRIVEEFKAGTKDEAEFWINFKGRVIHIRYFAVRDKNKNYKGVLEMSQDITDIKKIEGEKRLLSWDQ